MVQPQPPDGNPRFDAHDRVLVDPPDRVVGGGPAGTLVIAAGARRRVSLDQLAYALYLAVRETLAEYEDDITYPPPLFEEVQLVTQSYWRERAARVADGDFSLPPPRDGGFAPAVEREPHVERIGATDLHFGGFTFGDLHVFARDPDLASRVRDAIAPLSAAATTGGIPARCTHRLGRGGLCAACDRCGPEEGVVHAGQHYVAFVWMRQEADAASAEGGA